MTPARRFLLFFGTVHAALLVLSVARWHHSQFRAWEYLHRVDAPSFFPSRRIEMVEVGELGYRSWIRALQIPRPSVMTTDAHGCRNPPGIERPRVVVLGDSFVAGCAQSDEETLCARLGARLGEPAYCVASAFGLAPLSYLSDARFLGPGAPRVVVYAPCCRTLIPFDPGGFEPLGAALFDRRLLEPPPPSGALAQVEAAGKWVRLLGEQVGRDNGLTREARFAWNGGLYALRGHPDVIHPDGRPALVIGIAEREKNAVHVAGAVDGVLAGLLGFERALRARGARLVFAPLPDAFEVYPELFPPEKRVPGPVQLVLERARAAGVTVVDIKAALRANRSPYVYHRDDSHWNARGVELAAAALEGPVRDAIGR